MQNNNNDNSNDNNNNNNNNSDNNKKNNNNKHKFNQSINIISETKCNKLLPKDHLQHQFPVVLWM